MLAQIPEVTKEYPTYKSQVEYKSDTAFRFVLKNANDNNKELLMTAMAFDKILRTEQSQRGLNILSSPCSEPYLFILSEYSASLHPKVAV